MPRSASPVKPRTKSSAPDRNDHKWLKRRGQNSYGRTPRKVIIDGILLALGAGPATANQIDARMGVTYAGQSSTTGLLRMLERKGAVQAIGAMPRRHEKYGGHCKSQILWALVEKRA